jgi:hypothetical protein
LILGLDDGVGDILRAVNLAVHKAQKQLVIPAHQAGRLDEVCFVDGRENVVY